MRISVSVDMEGLAGVVTQGIGDGPDGAFDAAAFIGYHAGAGHPTDFRLPIQADYAAVLPGTVRVGGRTVRFTAEDGDAFYRVFLALTRLAATPEVG